MKYINSDGVEVQDIITAGDALAARLRNSDPLGIALPDGFRAIPFPHVEPVVARASEQPVAPLYQFGHVIHERPCPVCDYEDAVAWREAHDIEDTIGWVLLTPRDRTEIMGGAGIMACDLRGGDFDTPRERFLECESVFAQQQQSDNAYWRRTLRKDFLPAAD